MEWAQNRTEHYLASFSAIGATSRPKGWVFPDLTRGGPALSHFQLLLSGRTILYKFCGDLKGETLMPDTPEARACTRAFARVIGPFLVIVPAIIVVRAPNIGTILTAFFENEALVWITGGLLLFSGLLIIAHHQYWSRLSAILISLFGWFLALRGVVLLAAPQLIASGGAAAMNMIPIVQIGFGFLVLIGLWLTFVGWIAKPPAAS